MAADCSSLSLITLLYLTFNTITHHMIFHYRIHPHAFKLVPISCLWTPFSGRQMCLRPLFYLLPPPGYDSTELYLQQTRVHTPTSLLQRLPSLITMVVLALLLCNSLATSPHTSTSPSSILSTVPSALLLVGALELVATSDQDY